MAAQPYRRRIQASLVLLAGLALAWPLACRPPAERPDVILIVIDTLRADRLPFHGGPEENAPFLDELATRSLVFENAFSTSSWTAPATASIFTGLYPNQHGVVHGLVVGLDLEAARDGYMLNRIPDEIPSLPSFMRDLGYTTFGASANPNVDDRLGFERGFDHFIPFDPSTGKSADHLTKKVLAWRSELERARPYFLYLHLADPHGPYRRHSEWLRDDSLPPRNPLDDLVAYDSEIRFSDEHIRRIFEGLAVEPESIVIVTADHGQEFLDHGRRGHGFQLYSELTLVPLLVHDGRDPSLRGRIPAVVSNADILPTLRHLLGEGESAGSLLGADRHGPGQRQAFSMRTMETEAGAIRIESIVAERWKLIARSDSDALELYDLVADPGERHDLASDRPEIVERLARALAAQRQRASGPGANSSLRWTPSPEMAEALRALGYVEGEPNTALE